MISEVLRHLVDWNGQVAVMTFGLSSWNIIWIIGTELIHSMVFFGAHVRSEWLVGHIAFGVPVAENGVRLHLVDVQADPFLRETRKLYAAWAGDRSEGASRGT
ncbi:uncharacterized protein LTR77_007048 [Saxophila tyrrhenica]|uniref:Uncharacterized protein n=1 Tax=Saxophila tyrrhenica TaxID=1690608 RepID=A0AAV9P6X6_9PEZI|nr:hypothetical protein LTR77_007048 [Saxophila tyrrhenica]